MTDQELCYTFRNGSHLRAHWDATHRRYRAELTLPDNTVRRMSASPPTGMACILRWAQRIDAEVQQEPQAKVRI